MRVGAKWTCSTCLRAETRRRAVLGRPQPRTRPFSSATTHYADDGKDGKTQDEEQGALSRRLSEMAEETMDTSSKSDRNLMKDAGFSDDLKKQLADRIAQSVFESQNQQKITEVNLPSSAGAGTRAQAVAEPWKGTENLHDSTLRMLDDSYKKLRSPARIPRPISLRPAPKSKLSAADRLVNARDKTSVYTISRESGLSEEEREKMRKELKDRFSPGARPMPTTLQGLTSLANERIEDAIARGQFKNIQRGKGVNTETDYNANSPFLDTTEYFMNKIIQKQEIVPPWIEKQQELVRSVNTFRSRLRNDWKRHASRMISAAGGSIDSQVRRAKSYALAEERLNPKAEKRESFTRINSAGELTTITVEERLAAGMSAEEESRTEEPQPEAAIELKVTETSIASSPQPPSDAQSPPQPQIDLTDTPSSTPETPSSIPGSPSVTPAPLRAEPILPAPTPFRDPAWESAEHAYHTLSITNLNTLTRSYNLMAPKIAQRPYYTLQRELNKCYADIGSLLADEILERSRRPVVKVQVVGHKEGGVMEKFGSARYTGHVRTRDEMKDEPQGKGYGFKEFWRDLWGSKDGQKGVKKREVL